MEEIAEELGHERALNNRLEQQKMVLTTNSTFPKA